MDETHDLGPCKMNGPDFTEPTWWWLSFTDSTRPTGERLLGVVIVQAPGVDMTALDRFRLRRFAAGHPRPFTDPSPAHDVSHTLAVDRCWKLGVNPGGQVVGWLLPEEELPRPDLRERLLTKAELKAEDLWGGDVGERGGWENFL